ncbi:MAG: hypothetical protein K0S58_2324 [Nitrospira sp.]|nr:hypothetical protein [Nitrospira sp.]
MYTPPVNKHTDPSGDPVGPVYERLYDFRFV